MRCRGAMHESMNEEIAEGPGPEVLNEAGVNVEKESRIPKEEDCVKEDTSPFHDIKDSFLELHPFEQNEIIIQLFKERHAEITSIEKNLANKRGMYFEAIIDGI